MPSSVVFAALVLAWLVVLVPVVARRRQMVPRPAEADLSARVLPRTAGAPLIEEVAVTTAQTTGRGGGDRAATGSGSTSRGAGTAGTTLAERDDETPEALDAELDLDADRGDLDRDLDTDVHTSVAGGLDDTDDVEDEAGRDARPVGRERVLPRRAPDDDHDDRDDGYDSRYDADGGYDEYDDDLDEFDDRYDDEDLEDLEDTETVSRELRPYRPGRGGFDADAAAAAAQARYAFRQRIALGLIAVAVLSALAALVVSSMMWWLHAAADVVLVGYLIFLRRQTRIEEEVRARRAARLSGERRALEARRVRQAEHDARMAAAREDETDWIDGDYEAAYADDELDDEPAEEDTRRVPVARGGRDDHADHDEAPRWAAPRTPPPPVPEDLELVDDSDDDPAFHDLDGERTYGYRRAAGA
ncbi:divisome protein SepX/GlpR [Actinomycetospora sp. C-140]